VILQLRSQFVEHFVEALAAPHELAAIQASGRREAALV
jgi:hypothetical protein